MIKKSGFALILSIFLILAFAVLGLTVLSIIPGLDTDIWVKQLASSQALYLAESARNYALEFHLPWGTQFTNTTHFPDTTTKTFSSGSFTINYSNRQAKTVTTSFQGDVGACKRKLQINYDGWINQGQTKFRDYVVFATSTYNYPADSTFSYNYGTVINGDIYSEPPINLVQCDYRFPTRITGNIYVNDKMTISTVYSCPPPPTQPIPCAITGNVRLTGTFTNDCGSISGTVTQNISPPANLPTQALPTFTTTYYDQELQRANSIGSGSVTWSSKNLLGQNWYVNGTISLSGTISGGPANIVATDKITLADNTVVQEGISLISAKDIESGRNVNIGGGQSGKGGVVCSVGNYSSLFLQYSGIKIKGSILALPPSGMGVCLHAPEVNRSVWGLIYGQYILQGGGLIIQGIEVGNMIMFNYGMMTLTYDSSYVPLSIKGLYSVQRTAWQEISQ